MEVKRVSEMGGKGKTLIIYGDSGKGKTYAVGTLPEKETLIIDVDGGVETLVTMKKNHFVIRLVLPVKGEEVDEDVLFGFRKMGEIYSNLKNKEHSYKYVVIDSISEIVKYLLICLKEERGKDFLSVNEYGAVAQQMRELIRWYRDLTEIGINVIFTALETPLTIQEGGQGVVTRAFPLLTPKLSPEICGLVDMIGRMEVNPKTDERRIRFKGTEEKIAKTRVGGVEDVEDPDLSLLFKKINKTKGAKK